MKSIEIRVRLDRKQAKAAADDHVADSKRMEAASAEQVRAQKKGMAELLTDAQVKERAKADLVQHSNRQRINAARDAMTAEGKASSSLFEGMTSAFGAVSKLAGGLGLVALAGQGVQAIGDMWKAQRKDIEDSVDRLTNYREKVLELAALKDRLGRSTPETAEQIEFRSKTVQTADAAIALQSGALNTGQAAIASKFIDRAGFAKLMEYTGAFQGAVPQVSPTAIGNLTGMMPTIIGRANQSPEDVFTRTMGIKDIISKGGSDLSKGFADFTKNASYIMNGTYRSPEQYGAVQSQMSIFSPAEAGSLMEQFTRAMAGMLVKNRGNPGLEGSETQMEFGRKIGVKPSMDPVQIAELVAKDMAEQRAKLGANFNPGLYFGERGINNVQDALAMSNMVAAIGSGQFENTFGKMARGEAVPTFEAAMRPIQQFQAVDPVAQSRKAQIAKDAADAASAAGPEEFYLNLKRLAFENLRADTKNGIKGNFEEWNNSTLWGGTILEESKRLIMEQAKKAGVAVPHGELDYETGMLAPDTQETLGGGWQNRLFTSEQTRARTYYDLAQQIASKGVQATDIKELIGLMKQQVDIAKRAEDRAAKAVPPIGPTIPPVVPPGTGGRGLPARP